MTTDMKVFDNYEISPCKRYEEPDQPGKFYFEVCDPEEADVWTLYGHINGEGVEAIGDFANPKHAEERFFRITGIPFGSAQAIADRLRIMHAGPNLVNTMRAVSDWLNAQLFLKRSEIQEMIRTATANAIGGSPTQSPPTIIIEVRGGIVQDVQNVPPGFAYEIRDYDNPEDDGDAVSGRSS
jgi:hypothetical protein